MNSYQLISFKICPWVQRAAIVLREKQVPFDFLHIEPGERSDWFYAISPHGKVPVLRINEDIALFESNAIAEYLDETIAPRLHPEDPIQRAFNRAWTDYIPSFAAALGAVGSAADDAAFAKAIEEVRSVFAKVERALAGRSDDGPWFNGARYALVDAGYAPFLQRWLILEKLIGQSELAAYPLLAAWSAAIAERPSTHSFPPEEFETLYRTVLIRRSDWVARRFGVEA